MLTRRFFVTLLPLILASLLVEAQEAETERVIVTGSYIPTAESEAALPVTIETSVALQKQGANTPVEGLRKVLPSFVGRTANENDSNGGDGQAFINLRALGSGNTLTLINGRRAFGFKNVNALPMAALARTEVLKDGASAIYGSDAVAGVVNFVLLNGPGEPPFEGAEVHLLYGNTTDHDAHVRQAYLRAGVKTDKVAIAAAAEYYDRASLYSRDREISRTADLRPLGGFNGNSTMFPGRLLLTRGRTLVLNDLTENAPTRASYRPYSPGLDPVAFNFRDYSPAIPGVEKAQYFVTGKYNVFGNALQIYGDLLYAKTKQDNGLAPAPFIIPQARYENTQLGISNGRDDNGLLDGSVNNSNAAQLSIVRNSPYNPWGSELQNLSYRFTQELNNRRSFYDYDFYRYTAGIKGDFAFQDSNVISALGYDSGFVYERSDYLRTITGDARRGAVYSEIIAGNFNPFIGANAPVSGTIPTYNNGVLTGQTATYDNQAAADRASYVGRSVDYGRDFLLDGKINGNLFPKLFQGGISFNLGAEYRQSRAESIPDPVLVENDQLGFMREFPTDYRQEVYSVFGELSIPLVLSTMNLPGVRSLELGVAYRFEKFEDTDVRAGIEARFDNGGTPRVTLRYQPYADLTVRASYGQSFLSPTASQLFDPPVQTFPGLFDPATGLFVTGLSNGVFVSGNPGLQPEETETYTAGLVFTPKFIPGFSATVDFYQLYTTNVILDPGSFAVIAITANGNAGGGPDAPFSDIIERDPITREIISVSAQNQNASKRLVNGMDLTAAYQIPTPTFGTFTLSAGYNYFFTWKAEAYPGAGSTIFLGNYIANVPLSPGAIPYHKGYLRGEWEWRGLGFVSQVNYVSSFNDDSSVVPAARVVGGSATFPQYDIYRRVSDYATLDLQLSYEFRKAEEPAPTEPADGKTAANVAAGGSTLFQRLLDGTKVTVGVSNAFDRNPPTVLVGTNDNYDTSLYTIRNRYYYISLNKKF